MRRLGDRFVATELLGTGGMGSIWRGRDEATGAEVAIKILKQGLIEDAVGRERFRREAVALAKLRHPGIVRVVDVGEADGEPFTVLELVAGETLARVLERGPLAFEEARPILDRVLEALAVCHASGVIHRDVKPSNVMVGRSVGGARAVTLIDFGLARAPLDVGAKITETGTVQGTPQYMSPEQCRGEEVGPATDVYSACIVLYEALAGAVPFRGADAATIMAQHLFVEPPPIADASVDAVLRAGLAKDPDARPSANALRERLAAVAAGVDPEARAASSADARHDANTHGRMQRVLPERARPPASTPSGVVTVAVADPERRAAIQSCLGSAGIACGPDGDVEVVSAREDGLERVHGAGVIVIDVASPDETRAAIRAGAGDMLLVEAPIGELVAKVTRLFKKRARR